jgi:hypothetical protein
MADNLDQVFDEGSDRRTFLRRLVIGTAFAVPLVSSFSMTGISAAYAGQGHGRNSNPVQNPNQPCAPVQNPNSSQPIPIQNPNSSRPIPIQNPNQSGGKGHHGW